MEGIAGSDLAAMGVPATATAALCRYELGPASCVRDNVVAAAKGVRSPALQQHTGRCAAAVVLWPACSLIIETIPRHKDYSAKDAAYVKHARVGEGRRPGRACGCTGPRAEPLRGPRCTPPRWRLPSCGAVPQCLHFDTTQLCWLVSLPAACLACSLAPPPRPPWNRAQPHVCASPKPPPSLRSCSRTRCFRS